MHSSSVSQRLAFRNSRAISPPPKIQMSPPVVSRAKRSARMPTGSDEISVPGVLTATVLRVMTTVRLPS